MSEDSSKRSETEAESQEAESFSTTPSDVRQALKELASAVAKHDDDSSPEVGKALEGLASAVAGREPTEDDRRALVEFASDIGFTVPEEQDPQGKAAAAATQDQTEDCESLLANVTELLEQTAEAVASRQSGQELIRHADSVLKVFELTAVWEQETKSEKPMPWMMLIPLLILMKVLRCGLRLTAPCLGYNSPSLRDTIRFIRRQRRSLRSLKCSGIKNMRHMRRNLPESEQQSMEPNLFERVCVLFPLRILADLSSFVGLRTFQKPDKQMKRKLDEMLKDDGEGTSAQAVTSEDDGRLDPEGQEQKVDLNLTLKEQIDLYPVIPSEEDPDYKPDNAEQSSDNCAEVAEATLPSIPSPVPAIVIEGPETEAPEPGAQQEDEGSGEDSVTTVIQADLSTLEDFDSMERAAMSSGRQTPDESLTSKPDPLAMSYGKSTRTPASSSDESSGSASRSLLSKFLGNRRRKTAAI